MPRSAPLQQVRRWVSSHARCRVWPVCCGNVWNQRWCECGTRFAVDDRHSRCHVCRLKPPPPASTHPTPSAEVRVTENVGELMEMLPTHSHHRAPLVHFLSKGLDSHSAATILHCSDSYVRQCKRKDYSDADLLQDKYARNVKRQRTDPGALDELCNFFVITCPTKSGERSGTMHQYITDDALYQAYATTAHAPLSFYLFKQIKQWMRVKHAGKYLGQFDCSKCFRLKQLPSLLAAATTAEQRMELGQELQRCERHQQVRFRNSINIS